MSDSQRVVITGLGAVTPLGNSVADFWAGLKAGESGAGPITRFDTTKHKTKFACEVKGFDALKYVGPKDARKLDPFVLFSIAAGKEALADAGLDMDKVDRDEFGVIIGSGIGGLQFMEEQQQVLNSQGPGRVSPFLIPRLICNMAPGQTSIHLGLRGPSSCPVTACASGTNAIGDAYKTIQRGHATLMLAGGTEAALTPLGVAGFENMKALSSRNDSPKEASRPFDKDRDGFVMGEGAGLVVLESLEHARARGAHIYCEIVGYGMSSDAHHITAPAPEGEGAGRSMKMALRDGRLNLTDIAHINAHGTSTPMNDKNESAAIRNMFGDHAKKIAVCSIKSMTGHLLGAAGGIEAIAMALTIKHGIVPPTINYTTPDPDCDLDYTPNVAREMKVRAAISNSLGFGGHNATIAFKAFE